MRNGHSLSVINNVYTLEFRSSEASPSLLDNIVATHSSVIKDWLMEICSNIHTNL